MAISYRGGDRAFVDKTVSSECAGKQVEITEILSDFYVRVAVVDKPYPTYRIPINALHGYVPSVGDTIKAIREYTVTSIDSNGLYFRAEGTLKMLSENIGQIIKRKGEQMLEYAVGDAVIMKHLKAVAPPLRGATAKIIEISPMSVEAKGKVFAISPDFIAHYIPSVSDIVRIASNLNDLEVIGSVPVSCIVKDPTTNSDITVLCKDIIQIVKRAEPTEDTLLYSVGDIVAPIDTRKYTDVPRVIVAVYSELGIKFRGASSFVPSGDFRRTTKSALKGLIPITDNGCTYLIYDGDSFSKYLKDTYFITCHILHNMLNEPVEVDYVTKGLGAEIIYSNHGTKLDGSVNGVLKFINSVITR